MAPPISINISAPKAANYTPISPYSTSDHELSNTLLCPRYADADTSSAPPSPASIESFDILDSIPWRRGYTSYHSGLHGVRARDIWVKRKSQIVAVLLLVMLLVVVFVGGFVAVRHERGRTRKVCERRGGGDMCRDKQWAECVAREGVGYCKGTMGEVLGLGQQ